MAGIALTGTGFGNAMPERELTALILQHDPWQYRAYVSCARRIKPFLEVLHPLYKLM